MIVTRYSLHGPDAGAITAMRAATAGQKGALLGPDARARFNAMLAAGASAPQDVRYQRDLVDGVPGWWCRPADAIPGARLLFFHGGCYVLGSATALRPYAAHLAARSRADTFVPDYRLAPENPFPAAVDDAVKVFQRLAESAERIVVAGESAGGGLTLALLAQLASRCPPGQLPVGAGVFSPWLDLALTGESLVTRAEADPLFTKPSLQHYADLYLQGADPTDPRASPLYGPAPGVAPSIRIDVGDQEVMLDDSIRYAEKATDAGLDVVVNVWEGMPHGFQSLLGRLEAADAVTEAMGAFLRQRLERAHLEA